VVDWLAKSEFIPPLYSTIAYPIPLLLNRNIFLIDNSKDNSLKRRLFSVVLLYFPLRHPSPPKEKKKKEINRRNLELIRRVASIFNSSRRLSPPRLNLWDKAGKVLELFFLFLSKSRSP